MFAQGCKSLEIEDVTNYISEYDIACFYLNIHKIPCVINSPLRRDNNPSLGLYSPDGVKVYYTDFSTKEKGSLFTLLSKVWNLNMKETLLKIKSEQLKNTNNNPNIYHYKRKSINSEKSLLQCKIRDWEPFDIKYWKSYGISLKWLKYAEVYPISHKIIIKDNKKYIFPADKYAYAYVERKEGNITLKIYQPYNTKGYKWSNKHDSSVISLWTKVPETGEKLCICSSLKDALCLWENTGIPAIAVQGEGYKISNTAIKELKRRYKEIFILFDNDMTGLIDGEKLAALTGFTNIILPKFKEGKDISDLIKSKGKDIFLKVILPLFNINNK